MRTGVNPGRLVLDLFILKARTWRYLILLYKYIYIYISHILFNCQYNIILAHMLSLQFKMLVVNALPQCVPCDPLASHRSSFGGGCGRCAGVRWRWYRLPFGQWDLLFIYVYDCICICTV